MSTSQVHEPILASAGVISADIPLIRAKDVAKPRAKEQGAMELKDNG